MLSDYFQKILVISMDGSSRKDSIIAQFNDLKIPFEFYPATIGSKLDIEALVRKNIIQGKIIDDKIHLPLNLGELGCAASHIRIYKHVVNCCDNALVFEDDVILKKDIHEIIDLVMTQIPKTWDIIHFHSWARVGCGDRVDAGRIKIAPNVYKGYDEFGGTTCYAISKRGAKFLLSHAFPIRMTADGLTCLPTSKSYNGKVFSNDYFGYVTDPFLVDGFSDSSIIGENRGHLVFPLKRFL